MKKIILRLKKKFHLEQNFRSVGNCKNSASINHTKTPKITNLTRNKSDVDTLTVEDIKDKDDGLQFDSNLKESSRSKNHCRFCRKRFAAVELLDYHLSHLHGVKNTG